MINDRCECSIKHNIVFCFLSCALELHVWCVCMQAVKKKDLVSWYLYYIYEQGDRRVNG